MSVINYSKIFNYQDNSLRNDLAMMRRHVWEYLYTFGQPVIISRVYNQDEVTQGTASWDTTFDDVYGQGLSWSGQDLGSGAGFGPSSFTYVVFGDVVIDDQTPNRQGTFMQFLPNMVAPWLPQISDGDLIIQVTTENVGDDIQITGTGDRFQVQQVQPVPLRSMFRQYSGYMEQRYDYLENTDVLVCQNMQSVRLPRTNPLYNVPLDTTLEAT